MYSDLVIKSPYNFYLRILTSRHLKIKMADAKTLLLTLQNMDNKTFIEEINKHCHPKKLPSDKDRINTYTGEYKKILNHFNIKSTD